MNHLIDNITILDKCGNPSLLHQCSGVEVVNNFSIMKTTGQKFLRRFLYKYVVAYMREKDGLVYMTYICMQPGRGKDDVNYDEFSEHLDYFYDQAAAYCKDHNLTLWSY